MRGVRIERRRGHNDADGDIDDVAVDERIAQITGLVFDGSMWMWA